MAARMAPRIVHNRAALDQCVLAAADGLNAVAEAIVRAADPADSPYDPYPRGQGLPKQGGWWTGVNGGKIGGGSLRGDQAQKPRGVDNKGISAIAGFGFPGRFVEIGTQNTPAQPFLTPAAQHVLPGADVIISKAAKKRLGKGLKG